MMSKIAYSVLILAAAILVVYGSITSLNLVNHLTELVDKSYQPSPTLSVDASSRHAANARLDQIHSSRHTINNVDHSALPSPTTTESEA